MYVNRNPELLLALDRIADAARQDATENPLQVILEIAEDALSDRPRPTPQIADRIEAALGALAEAEVRLAFSRRVRSANACRYATSIIRDLARLAGVEVAAEQKEAA